MHIWVTAIDEKYSQKHVAQTAHIELAILLRKHGYRYYYCEITNEYSLKTIKHFKVFYKRVNTIPYNTYKINGKNIFDSLKGEAYRSKLVALRALREVLTGIAMRKQGITDPFYVDPLWAGHGVPLKPTQ